MRILFIGDVVGRPGRRVVRRAVPRLRRERSIDFVVANAENAAGGSGITPDTVGELLAAGVDCLTTGDHVFKQREGETVLRENHRVLRPLNLSERAAGRGVGIYEAADGTTVAVINLQGRIFMPPIDNPFRAAETALEQLAGKTRLILVDFHAEATSEKVAMGWFLDGRVTAVCGTHTHIPTADERILPGGTAYITDLGMTGPYQSVLGRRTDRVLAALLTDMPQRFVVATGDVRLAAALITAEAETGKATNIQRILLREADLPAEPGQHPENGEYDGG